MSMFIKNLLQFTEQERINLKDYKLWQDCLHVKTRKKVNVDDTKFDTFLSRFWIKKFGSTVFESDESKKKFMFFKKHFNVLNQLKLPVFLFIDTNTLYSCYFKVSPLCDRNYINEYGHFFVLIWSTCSETEFNKVLQLFASHLRMRRYNI